MAETFLVARLMEHICNVTDISGITRSPADWLCRVATDKGAAAEAGRLFNDDAADE